MHQIGIGLTINNIGSSYIGYDASEAGIYIYPATINNQYNTLSFQYSRQLVEPSLKTGLKWFNHVYLKFSADYTPDIPLQSLVAEHSFFRFGLGLQYQLSSLW